MNANELADELEFVYSESKEDAKTIKESATMLRQQQAEIEALKYEKSSGVYDLAKTLTDEEIKHLQRECIADAYAQAHFHGGKYINSQQAILNFARAILRKAQEK